MCAVPGSCWVCVLSLSLMSTHSSHCPYLKWPEPHQQIKSQAPPARSARSGPSQRSIHCLEVSVQLRHTTHRHNVSHRGKTSHEIQSFQNILEHNQLSSLLMSVICDEQQRRFFSFLSQEIIFQDISRTTSIKLFKGILSFSNLSSLWLTWSWLHHCDMKAQNGRILL